MNMPMAENSEKQPAAPCSELLAHQQFLEGEPLAEVREATFEEVKQDGPSHEGFAPKLA